MTEDEAIKFLAAKMGEMQLLCGSANYRIMVDMGGMFESEYLQFPLPAYGKTPNEVMKNAVIMRFGDDFVETANTIKQVEKISAIGFGRIMEKRFPSLHSDNYDYDRLLELCRTGK